MNTGNYPATKSDADKQNVRMFRTLLNRTKYYGCSLLKKKNKKKIKMKKLNQKEIFWVVDPVSPTTFLHSSRTPSVPPGRREKSRKKYDTHVPASLWAGPTALTGRTPEGGPRGLEGKTNNSNVQPFLTRTPSLPSGRREKFNLNKYSHRKSTSLKANPKQEVVSITYEEIGLFPRSFSRVLDVRPVPL